MKTHLPKVDLDQRKWHVIDANGAVRLLKRRSELTFLDAMRSTLYTAGGGSVRMLVTLAARVIRDQLCQPLELIQMPNVVNNLLQPLKDVSFDPGRQHSITWQSGFAGIGYNRDKVGRELKTLDDLWADDLKGRIVVLSEFRDTAGLVMQSQGVDIDSDWGKAECNGVLAFLDLMSGTHLTDEQKPGDGRQYVSQREKLEDFEKHMREYGTRPEVRDAMAGYMDLVIEGRREIFRLM